MSDEPELLRVRLVDGVGGSVVIDVMHPGHALAPGCAWEMARPDPYDASGLGACPRDAADPDARLTFAFTGERDLAGLPVFRLEGSGFPPIRYATQQPPAGRAPSPRG
jgi:hypothetical protein